MTRFGTIKFNAEMLSLDASAKMRVSQQTTLFDGKILNAERVLLWENAGTGTTTYSGSKMAMSVSSGQWLVRQSKRFYPYFSGKSQVIEITCDNFQTEANIIKRKGYFSSSEISPYNSLVDGFWIEDDGVTKRLKASRVGTETLNVEMASWNGSPNYDWSSHDWDKFNVVIFDFLFLGGAVLRMFIDTPSGFKLAHIHIHASNNSDVFIQSPNQPVRYEIRSNGGSGMFRYICCQVATEGSIDESGLEFSVDTGHSGISMATIGTTYPLIAIKKATSCRDVAVQLTSANVFLSFANDQINWFLALNPTFSAPLTYSPVVNTCIEKANGNGTITVTAEGTRIGKSGYIFQYNSIPENTIDRNFLSYLGSKLNNEMDVIALCIKPITAGVTVFGGLSFKEY